MSAPQKPNHDGSGPGAPGPSPSDDAVERLVHQAQEAHAAERARAAEAAAEAVARGLPSDAVLAPDAVRPLAGRPVVPRALSSGDRPVGTVEPPRRRAGDSGHGSLADLPMYDPLAARRRRTPEWLSAHVGGLVAVDAVAVVVAAVVGAHLTGDGSVGPWHVAGATLLWVVVLRLAGAYRETHLGAGVQEYRRVLVAATGLTALVAVVEAAGLGVTQGPAAPVLAVAVATAVTLLGRRVARVRLHAGRRRGLMSKRVVLVGRETALVDIATRLRRDATSGWTVVGACVPDPAGAGGLARIGVPVLGGLDFVPAVLDQARADAVMVASASDGAASYLRQLAWRLEGTNIEVLLAPGLVEVAVDRLEVRPTISFPVVQIMEPSYRGLRRLAKSVLDRAAALIGLFVLGPLLVVLAVLVKHEDGGPVLYRQARAGRYGRTFDVLKFRSMTVGADAQVEHLAEDDEGNGVLFKMRADPRVTRVGRVLRRFSLDELPQLVNVLRGDMSLVGPRPALPSEVATYGPDMQRRLLVRPGVTGLWQVSGRSDLSWAETVELDVRYVDNWSVGRDLSILARTFRAVLAGSGAY